MDALLDHFGSTLVQRVRDKAIQDWDMILDGRMKDSNSLGIRHRLSGLSKEQLQIVSWLIPQVVDTTLHHLLWTLEQEESIKVSVQVGAERLEDVSQSSDGLSGELPSEEGWIARFSKQRRT